MKKVNVMFQSTDEINEFVNIVSHYPMDLDLKYGSYMVDGKSILGILSLGTHKKMELHILSEDCEDLVEKIGKFIVKD